MEGIAPMLAAYVLLVTFLVAERLLRRGQAARTLTRAAADRGSTLFIGVSFGIGLLAMALAPVLNAHGVGPQLPQPIRWIGAVVALLGLLLRIWASRVLGEFYTRTLLIGTHQRVVQEGPYRLVRHPGYLGDLLLWIGAGVASGNVIVLCSFVLLFVSAYGYRVHVEEAMLRQAFGDAYAQYARHTRRLIPFLY